MKKFGTAILFAWLGAAGCVYAPTGGDATACYERMRARPNGEALMDVEMACCEGRWDKATVVLLAHELEAEKRELRFEDERTDSHSLAAYFLSVMLGFEDQYDVRPPCIIRCRLVPDETEIHRNFMSPHRVHIFRVTESGRRFALEKARAHLRIGKPFAIRLFDKLVAQEVAANAPERTAWEALAFFERGETPCSREYGAAVERRMEFLASSVGTLSAEDDAFYAVTYALCVASGMTGNPNAKHAARDAIGKLLSAQGTNELWQTWSRTGLAVQSLRTASLHHYCHPIGDYGGVLKSVVAAVKKELRADNPTDEAVAVGGMILTLTKNADCVGAKAALARMCKWKFGDARPGYVAYCATAALRTAALRRGATEASMTAWMAWMKDLRQACTSIEINDANMRQCLWLALDYLSSTGRRLPEVDGPIKPSTVGIEVEI